MKTTVYICSKSSLVWSCLAVLLVGILAGLPVQAQVLQDTVAELKGVTITEHLGDRVPLDLTFIDDHGQPVTLGDYFKAGKPVILNLVYFRCPMLCNFVMNGVADAAKQLPWSPGNEYRLVAISINPRETWDLAAAKKANYLHDLGKPGAENGWAFLVGDSTHSKALADALGWGYYYDKSTGEYVHTAATFVLTPDGRISRYLYGLTYPVKDVKLALLEASEGRIGSTFDRLILYCYHYDPDAKGYVLFAMNVMKLGGVAVVVLLGLLLAVLWHRERGRRREASPAIRQA
jgi:protein SCO1